MNLALMFVCAKFGLIGSSCNEENLVKAAIPIIQEVGFETYPFRPDRKYFRIKIYAYDHFTYSIEYSEDLVNWNYGYLIDLVSTWDGVTYAWLNPSFLPKNVYFRVALKLTK